MDNLNEHNWTSFIPKPSIFIDIGVKAIAGNETLEAKAIKDKWPDVSIIGFEPHSSRYKECLDKYPGKLYNIAVGKEDKQEKFFEVDLMAVHYPRVNQDKKKPLTVKMRSLDSLESELGPWSNIFIWSDTEGCEYDILLGSKALLENNKIMGLNLELWDTKQSDGWCQAFDVVGVLSSYGFIPVHKWSHNPNDPQRDVVFLRKT